MARGGRMPVIDWEKCREAKWFLDLDDTLYKMLMKPCEEDVSQSRCEREYCVAVNFVINVLGERICQYRRPMRMTTDIAAVFREALWSVAAVERGIAEYHEHMMNLPHHPKVRIWLWDLDDEEEAVVVVEGPEKVEYAIALWW